MAYMSQEKKQALAPAIKKICDKYGVKARLAVQNHSTLVLNITQAPIDFIGSYNRVNAAKPRHSNNPFTPSKGHLGINTYWYHEHFDGRALDFLKEVLPAMNVGNHDRSDIQTDYFDVGWYVSVNIGKWDKPFALTNA